jgi:hypothetical protein
MANAKSRSNNLVNCNLLTFAISQEWRFRTELLQLMEYPWGNKEFKLVFFGLLWSTRNSRFLFYCSLIGTQTGKYAKPTNKCFQPLVATHHQSFQSKKHLRLKDFCSSGFIFWLFIVPIPTIANKNSLFSVYSYQATNSTNMDHWFGLLCILD